MHTDHVDILLPEYVRGTLERDIAAGVEAHLRACPACRSEFESLGRTFAVLDGNRTEKLSHKYLASILPNVHQRLERRGKRAWLTGPFVNKFLLPLGVATVLVAVLLRLGGNWALRGSENELKSFLTSASADDIAEILRENVSPQDVSALDTTILTHALSNERFAGRRLVSEALSSDATSPFNVFADVTPQQILGDLQDPDAEQVLQQLAKMETP